MSPRHELVEWAEALDDGYQRRGWFGKVPLMLVGYETGRVAVVALEPTYRVMSARRVERAGTRPVEVASTP